MAERRRTPPRPYSRQRTYPSVTTVIGVMDKPGLQWGAAKETALFAYHHRDEWEELAEADAVERLRKHHDVLWKGRAGIGTIVHSVNEAWSWDEDADLPALIEAMDRTPTVWEDRGIDQVVADLQPYIDGLEKFYNDFTPETIATEQVVRDPDRKLGYIGQTDWTAYLGTGQMDSWRLDLKTTAKTEEDSAIYTDSWRPQLCAYDRAPEVVLYTPEGVEEGTEPNVRCDRFGVVHLRGDGDYHLIEVECGDDVFEAFLAMRRLHDWAKKGHKKPAARVVPPPAAIERKTA